MPAYVNWKTITAAIIALLLGGLAWLIAPAWSFFAHNGEAPFTPFGWVEMPQSDAPSTHIVHDTRYQDASDQALAALAAWRARIGAPSYSAAVSVGGEVVWEGATGWADLAEERAVDTGDLYRIGSTSKAITAIALARLVDRGVIDLDAPLSSIFEDLPNPQWAEITPRQLASHMAGVPHYDGVTEVRGLYQMIRLSNHFADIRDALAQFDESEMLFAPGEAFEYSSLGTVLLGATMSEAAGMSYREIMRQEVFEPAGALNTIVAPRDPGEPMVELYYRDDDRYRVWRPVDLSHRLPGGGWASSPAQLVQMGALMLDETFISPETREAFWTPQHLNNGEVNEQGYAIGWRWREWEIEGVGAVRNANHGGVSRGSQSWLMVLPDYDMVIALNMNGQTDPFWEFGGAYEEIAAAFIPVVQSAVQSPQ